MKKIGVFLPNKYQGGSLNGAKNIAKMMHLGSRACQEPVEIIFSCAANFYNLKEDFRDLMELGIQIRETTWENISKEDLSTLLEYMGEAIAHLKNDVYCYPKDGTSNFHDCDFWFFVSDRVQSVLAPFKPYGMLVYDYVQRYVPEVFGDFYEKASFVTAQNAQFVLTTTPDTQEDVVQYAGVKRENVHLMPLEFDPLIIDYQSTEFANLYTHENFFIWTTNTTQHKNHFNALEALLIYFNELKGKLNVIVTGGLTEQFQSINENEPIPYIKQVSQFISKKEVFKKRLKILGNLSSLDYVSLLNKAKFLWHPALKDNGTYSVIEAAYYGIPSLSSAYPPMHFLNEKFQLNLMFFDAENPREMAEKLKKMEEDYEQRVKILPTREFLEQFSYKNVAPCFWKNLSRLL